MRRAIVAVSVIASGLSLATLGGPPLAPARADDDDPPAKRAPDGDEPEAEKPLAIPYFAQDGENCVQAQVRMALGYFLPGRDFPLEELDRRTGRGEGQWTWLSQVLPMMVEEGLDARFYSSLDYLKLHPDRLEELYDEETADVLRGVTNWDSVLASRTFLKESGRFEHRKLTAKDLDEAFARGWVIIAIIDVNVLQAREGPYAGHGITITWMDDEVVRYHDSAHAASQSVPRERFLAAWNAHGTDNDTIIIRGKLATKPGDERGADEGEEKEPKEQDDE